MKELNENYVLKGKLTHLYMTRLRKAVDNRKIHRLRIDINGYVPKPTVFGVTMPETVQCLIQLFRYSFFIGGLWSLFL